MPKDSGNLWGRWVTVPARRSNEPTAEKRARRVIIALVIASLLSIFSILTVVANMGDTVDFSEVDPQGRGVADSAAFQVMNRQTVHVPTAKTFDPTSAEVPRGDGSAKKVDLPYDAQSMTWIGFDLETFSDGDNNLTTFEVHHYLVIPAALKLDEYGNPIEDDDHADGQESDGDQDAPDDPEATPEDTDPTDTPSDEEDTDNPETSEPSDGDSDSDSDDADDKDSEKKAEVGLNPLQLDVPVLITSDGGRLAGVPSFSPWTKNSKPDKGEADYSNYNNLQVDPSSQAVSQVGRWAMAYAENDQDTLLSLTGDKNTKHMYRGLGDFTIPDNNGAVQVLSTISAEDGQQIMRVRVLLESTSVDVDESKENAYRTYADFDLLIANPSSAQPNVVAWGPAGSAAGLHPYSNALPRK